LKEKRDSQGGYIAWQANGFVLFLLGAMLLAAESLFGNPV
jgi:hypothetical protein